MIQKLIIIYLLGVLGYLILATYVVPSYAYGTCSYADQIPSNAVVALSLNQWISGNFISGLPLFLMIFSVVQLKECQDCIFYVSAILGVLYTLFQNVWSVIGYLIFNDYYRNSCASTGSFNIYIEAVVYYGIILFPTTTILVILVAVISHVKKNTKAENAVVENLIIENNLSVDVPIQIVDN